MNEVIVAENPRTGRKVSFEVSESKSIGEGYRTKRMIEAVIRNVNGRIKRIHLIEKEMGDAADSEIKIWSFLYAAGLPVVQTKRKTDDGNIIETNLKTEGVEFYGRGTAEANSRRLTPEEIEKRNEKHLKTFIKFLDATYDYLSFFKSVRKKITFLFRVAMGDIPAAIRVLGYKEN